MANYKTLALSEEQYTEILQTIESGFMNSRPNPKVGAILRLEANLGIRISDILNLTLDDIVYDNGRYRLDIIEQKTFEVIRHQTLDFASQPVQQHLVQLSDLRKIVDSRFHF